MSLTTFDVYGDGGAFPDIHVTQYPLGMGKKSSSVTLSRYEVVPGDISFEPDDLKKPSEEEIADLVKKTAELLAEKKPTNLKLANNQKPTYIRYTPKSNGPGYNDTAKNRIIRMVEAPVDPLEPSKFRHRRVPRGPPSPPVPINHSPPRKLSVKDMAEWKIPPCISNWKNPKGYTIPLDKRLAADGRGLQETSINDNFAKLSEALYIAERKAREELDHRMRMAKQLASKQKQKKEDELRRLAMQAREERARGSTVGPNGAPTPAETEEEREAREKRNIERLELRREVEREKRMELRGKKKEKDRDISERIALGQTATNRSTESFYDTRLFNQSSGIGSGFRDDDDYNVFENPLFKTNATTYRPEKEKIAIEAERSSRTEKYSRLEFEKDQDDDPFGLGQILTETKTNKRGLEPDTTSRNKKSRV